MAVVIIVLLTAMNLRGVRESGAAFAVPVVPVHGRRSSGWPSSASTGSSTETCRRPRAPVLELQPETGYETIGGLALVFLLLRAFSSGCAALTGVEAISNGVPAFKKPKSKNAATTLLLMGSIAITMLRVDDGAVAAGPGSRSPRTPRPSSPATASLSATPTCRTP